MVNQSVAETPAAPGIPHPRTPLVGRRDDVASVARRLSEVRLVTLTGPGGVGKTRISLAVAEAVLASRPQGVAVADLSAITDPDLVGPTVRGAFGIPEMPSISAILAVIDRLQDTEGLLVVDNCEHLLATSAAVIDELLSSCPGLSVLATSREPLAVDGEVVWPVTPLHLPPRGAGLEAVRSAAAIQLFEQRAAAVAPDFRLTEANAEVVNGVCRRLGGQPLAIELAAARVRVLSIEQILAGLDDMFSLLAGGVRTSPLRQQSLKASLDWSYKLLEEREQVALRRVGAFPGGFDLPAAESVITLRGQEPHDVLDLITRLTDRSLLATYTILGRRRYRLLAPVREYARERLALADEEIAAGRSHLEHFARLSERIEPLLAGPSEAAGLDELEQEGNNLRAALSFAQAHQEFDLGVRLITAIPRLCIVRGHYREGRYWMDWAATADPASPPELRAKALLGGGTLAFLACDYPAAVRRLERSLQLYRDLDDWPGISAALQMLGGVARERGRYARAVELYQESRSLAEAQGDKLAVARARLYVGFVAWLQCQWDAAEDETSSALAAFRRIGNDEGVVWSLLSLGIVAAYRGDDIGAGQLLSEAHDGAARLQFREGVAWARHELGRLRLRVGDPEAEELLLTAFEGHTGLGDRWRMSSVLEDLATARLAAQAPEKAVELLAAADALRSEIGTELAPCERSDHQRTEDAARAAVSPEAFARAWARGHLHRPAELLQPPANPAARDSTPSSNQPEGTTPSRPLTIRSFGEATVVRDGHPITTADWGYGKPRELLFLLVSSPPLTKSEIGTAIWPDLDPPALRNAFHTALRDLRRALGDPGWITFSAGRYGFERRREHFHDLEVFQEALAAARRNDDPATALPHLERAIGAYKGDFAKDLPDSLWLRERRDALQASYLGALTAAGRLLRAAGRDRHAAQLYRTLIRIDPLDEAAHRNLMRCLTQLGQPGRAVRVYDALAARLRDELGVDPAPQTKALRRELDH